jgi:hypothetical protein
MLVDQRSGHPGDIESRAILPFTRINIIVLYLQKTLVPVELRRDIISIEIR